ncbi:MAG: hypothetical protein WDZ49_05850 [Litorilinea sp.]
MGLGSLQLGRAFGVLLKTTPLLLVRLGVYLAFWVVLLIYLGIVFGVGFLLSQLWAPLGVILGLIAFGSTFFLYRLAYRYVFYLLKAAHLAIVAEILHNGTLPAGVSQLAWGRQQVTERFGQVSVMFVVDEMVDAIVRTVTNAVVSIANMLPGDTMRSLARVAQRIIQFATSYVDEAIMARAFWRRDENIWQSAEQGIVLYGMVWKPLLINAVALMVLSYVPFLFAVLILAAPIGFLVATISQTLAAWSIILVFILSYFVKVAVGDSFAMIAMVAAFQKETAGLQPDPAMEARITGMSDKFGELKNRAMQAMPFGQSGGQPDGRPDGRPDGQPGGQAPGQGNRASRAFNRMGPSASGTSRAPNAGDAPPEISPSEPPPPAARPRPNRSFESPPEASPTSDSSASDTPPNEFPPRRSSTE